MLPKKKQEIRSENMVSNKTFNYKLFYDDDSIGSNLSKQDNYLKISVPYQESYYLINMDNLECYKIDDYAIRFYFDNNDSIGLFIMNDSNIELFEKLLLSRLESYLPVDRYATLVVLSKLK